MLDQLRGISIVRGFRGGDRGDEPALHDLLLRVSAMIEACPEILELDLNPVMVLPDGVRIVDFRIRVGYEGPRPASRRVEY
jgi:acetyltransferase